MDDRLIEAVEVMNMECGGGSPRPYTPANDVVIFLRNGRVVQVSPDFNAINVWESRASFEEGAYDTVTSLLIDLGGNAAGEFEGEPYMNIAP